MHPTMRVCMFCDMNSAQRITGIMFSGPTTVTTSDRIRFKSSGRPFDGVEIKIDSPDDSGAGEVSSAPCTLYCTFLL